MTTAPTFQQVRAEFTERWGKFITLPSRKTAVAIAGNKVANYKDRYKLIEKATGIPWYFVGIIHYREADCNFHCHLHNGDPLTARTKHVPAGRPLTGSAPFRFEESAIDALTMMPHHLDLVRSWTIERMLYEWERYNGEGYRLYHHTSSAYLWGDTDQHELGKYTSDGHYDPGAPEVQVGCAALLRYLMTLDNTVSPKLETQSSPVVRPPEVPATQVTPPTASTQGLPTASKVPAPWFTVLGVIINLVWSALQALRSAHAGPLRKAHP